MRKSWGAAAALLVLSVGACSVSVGSAAVAPDDLEQQVGARLAEQVGQEPDAVDCPDALEAKEGAEVRCVLTSGGSSIGLTVTATAVDGDDVSLGIQVDDDVMDEGAGA
ncbi:DUF4333 domain-containing protein [Cellulomonas sp. NPDC058312]|uniref:DUF4333 domain-containing protein n=1 Tax=Cellulomonas sp. NPDC058312 TaxID=3346441 RepID=UPI0036E7A11B